MIQRCLEFALIPLIRLLLLVYFRQIEVVGREKVPHALPLVYTPNHLNSVLDGLLSRCFLPRDPRPLAKATLWDIKLMRPLLVAAHAIPVYRQQDSADAGYASQNRDMFSACYEALQDKSCIVLFPEGQSHSESELQELKTGAARIALGAEQQSGPLGVRIIPVGLNFDAKQKFRSRVLIAIGDPLDLLEGLGDPDPGDREAVAHVMAGIENGMKSVTLNYPSWEEANVMHRAADLYASPDRQEPARAGMADEFSVQKQLADAYALMKQRHPRKITAIVEAVHSYDRLLKVLSVRHEHVIQEHPQLLKLIFSLRKLSLFVIRLPLALLGLFLNAAPYFLIKLVSRIKVQPDRASTTKLVAGFILYPLCWSLQAMLLGNEWVPPLAWWMLAPLSGISSLLFRERHAQLLEELRTYLKLNGQAEMKAELEQRLENIQLEVAEFLAISASLQSAAQQAPAAPAL